MTGIETALLISQLAGPLMSMLGGGGSDQERQSFSGMGDIAPENMMRSNRDLLAKLMGAATERAGQSVGLPSAYVQQPGAYTGGGMPFPIGLVAQDPALANPSLLSRPGSNAYADIMKGLGTGGDFGGVQDGVSRTNPPGASVTPGDTFGPGMQGDWANEDPDGPLGPHGPLGDAFDNFFQQPHDQRTTENPNGTTDGAAPEQHNAAESRGPRRRSGEGLRADDLGLTTDQNPGDDLKQAMGAVDLFLQAYNGNI